MHCIALLVQCTGRGDWPRWKYSETDNGPGFPLKKYHIAIVLLTHSRLHSHPSTGFSFWGLLPYLCWFYVFPEFYIYNTSFHPDPSDIFKLQYLCNLEDQGPNKIYYAIIDKMKNIIKKSIRRSLRVVMEISQFEKSYSGNSNFSLWRMLGVRWCMNIYQGFICSESENVRYNNSVSTSLHSFAVMQINAHKHWHLALMPISLFVIPEHVEKNGRHASRTTTITMLKLS